jgi:hypothetical protein
LMFMVRESVVHPAVAKLPRLVLVLVHSNGFGTRVSHNFSKPSVP